MLKRLYDWAISLAARKSAEWWLGFIAFIESSVFVIPAEVLFVPMGLARPERVWRYAVIATVASVLGGVFGWGLGHYAYEYLARPVLEWTGGLAKFEELRSQASGNFEFLVLILITSSVAHLPPMKVVSIVSGALSVNIWLFIASCVLARGARFALMAWLLRRYGEPIREFIEKRLTLLAAIGAALVILLFVAYKVWRAYH
jgi:membrane protein YqaA with SNARE-associated domain